MVTGLALLEGNGEGKQPNQHEHEAVGVYRDGEECGFCRRVSGRGRVREVEHTLFLGSAAGRGRGIKKKKSQRANVVVKREACERKSRARPASEPTQKKKKAGAANERKNTKARTEHMHTRALETSRRTTKSTEGNVKKKRKKAEAQRPKATPTLFRRYVHMITHPKHKTQKTAPSPHLLARHCRATTFPFNGAS